MATNDTPAERRTPADTALLLHGSKGGYRLLTANGVIEVPTAGTAAKIAEEQGLNVLILGWDGTFTPLQEVLDALPRTLEELHASMAALKKEAAHV